MERFFFSPNNFHIAQINEFPSAPQRLKLRIGYVHNTIFKSLLLSSTSLELRACTDVTWTLVAVNSQPILVLFWIISY